MKKYISFTILIGFVLSLLFCCGYAYADDLTTSKMGIQSDGYNLRISNKIDSDAIRFDEDTCTLTIENMNVSEDLKDSKLIYISNHANDEFTLTVELVGENNIVNTGEGSATLFTTKNNNQKMNIKFTGSGSLSTNNLRVVKTKSGSITLESGTFSVVDCPGDNGAFYTSKSMSIGGDARVSIKAKAVGGYKNAIIASKLDNSYKSLVGIDGKMPVGSQISDSNAVYKITKLNGGESYSYEFKKRYTKSTASLVRWINGKTAKISGLMVKKIMGSSYRVNQIENNAFNNSPGKKVTKLIISPRNTVKFKKDSLKGLKNVKTLYITPSEESSYSLVDYTVEYFAHDTGTTTPCVTGVHKGSSAQKKCLSSVGSKSTKVKILPCKLYMDDKRYHNASMDHKLDKKLKSILNKSLGLKSKNIAIDKKSYKLDDIETKYLD